LRAFFDYQREMQTGVTGQTVAKTLGISNAFMSQIRHGNREPALTLALRIQRVCRVPIESLILRQGWRQKAS
jgi:DNA-binding XRE family transcriptional regulator